MVVPVIFGFIFIFLFPENMRMHVNEPSRISLVIRQPALR